VRIPDGPDRGDAIRDRLLAIIAALLATAALRESYAVTMPLAVAVVVIAAIWPVKPWLDRALPSGLSYLGTVLVLVFILAGFVAAVYFSTAQVVWAFAQNWDQLERVLQATTAWADRWGLSLGGEAGYARLVGFGRTLLANAYTVFVYLGFIALLVILGLPEVPSLRRKIRDELDAADRRELIDAVDTIAGKIRQYLGVTTLTSLMTGIASAAWAFAMGLDLALVWGVLNFLLNYIPVVGNIIGIVPPSLYALIQFQDWTMPLIVFAGFSAIQIAISNFVYPMLQGRSLSLSPIAVIVALAFWSWVWGIAGALIAVPLTVALVIACEHFSSTRWVATLLSGRNGPDGR
jgi:AI-2 transport protein TqsA